MNIQSNTYTFIYSTVVVILVATCLAIVSTLLKPAQQKNVEIEKKQDILATLRINSDKLNVEELYSRYITDSYTLNIMGEKIDGVDPFFVDMADELRKPAEERNLPAFVSARNDSTFIVVPVYGKGLWGPIWGYVSFIREDSVPSGMPYYNKIFGVTFDHKSETPGLGAEINQTSFQLPFRGKQIFDGRGNFVSVQVVKNGADESSLHEVDAISGGTITSVGLQEMLEDCLVSYERYFKMQY